MLAEYSLEITASCPVDRKPDVYECRVTARRTIPVEDILKAVDSLKGKELYQEQLTGELHRMLAADVETVGYHSGVKAVVRFGGGW